MNGLHTCKPANTPVVGQVKNFVVTQQTGKSGVAYTKIKSGNQDNPGTPFTITKVAPTGHTDQYGNISFNLEIEPANGAPVTPPATTARPTQSPVMSKDDYWNRKEERDIEAVQRMGRAHSQEMALRYAALKGLDTITHDQIAILIDWFQRDLNRTPNGKTEPAPEQPESPEPDEVETQHDAPEDY